MRDKLQDNYKKNFIMTQCIRLLKNCDQQYMRELMLSWVPVPTRVNQTISKVVTDSKIWEITIEEIKEIVSLLKEYFSKKIYMVEKQDLLSNIKNETIDNNTDPQPQVHERTWKDYFKPIPPESRASDITEQLS